MLFKIKATAQLEVSVDCNSGVADLSSITINNIPATTTLTWHTGTPTTDANRLIDVTALTPNTYYTAFYNPTNNAYTIGPVTVTVTPPFCIQNVCPAIVASLPNTPSNIPSGTMLTWHTSVPTTDANKVIAPTQVGAGNYYASFYDDINGCYSGEGYAARGVIVEIITCTTINAGNDDFSGTILAAGDTTLTVFSNDDANGITPAIDALVTTPIIIADGGLTGATFNSNGTLNIPPSATSGNYTLVYEVCLESDNSICNQAILMLTINCTIPKGKVSYIRNN